MILTVVFYVFVVFTGIQIIYYLTFSSFLFNKKKEKETTEQQPVSVIVFAKNSAVNLEKNLPFLLTQEYSKFEIVIVNNASTDNTTQVLESFKKKKNKNIKILDVENNEAFWGNKKYALTLGIKASKYDHLLFTEVNSKPLSKFWIAEMSENFSISKSIVLGYGKYKKENTLINVFIRFENLFNAIKCFSFAKLGSPFMGYNSNFGYKKTEFFNVKGFINHIKIKDGETDLFLKDAASRENISYTISNNSFIETEAPKSFKNWFYKLRENRILKNKYQWKHRFLLDFFVFSKFVFYVLATVSLFCYPFKLIFPFIITYFLLQYIVVGFSARKLKEPYILFFTPFLEIGLLLIQISIFIANLISKPNHWR